jgi:hypothetical protein
MGKTHHDARPLTDEEAQQLYGHIRAVEGLIAERDDINQDINERKTLCCEVLPINRDVFDFVIKRRKAGRGTCGNFDSMLELVEEGIQKVEATRREEGGPPRKAPEAREREEAAELVDDEPEDEDESPPFEVDAPDSAEAEQQREPEPVEARDPF